MISHAHQTTLKARYALMTSHVLLWATAFVLNLALSDDIALIVIHSALGFAMLIYVPATLIITYQDRMSTHRIPFDHAGGGEVAYLAVQMAGWLTAFIWGVLIVAIDDRCHNWNVDPRYGWFEPRPCITMVAVSVLAAVEVAISTALLVMVIKLVRRLPDKPKKQGFRLSMNQLLRGSTNAKLGEKEASR